MGAGTLRQQKDRAPGSSDWAEKLGSFFFGDTASAGVDATVPDGPPDGQQISRDELTPQQQANLKRYEKKLPSVAEPTSIVRLPDGSIEFESRVPGRVPGSFATYTKVLAEDGTTVGYTKTTTLPDGTIAHTKDKMPK